MKWQLSRLIILLVLLLQSCGDKNQETDSSLADEENLLSEAKEQQCDDERMANETILNIYVLDQDSESLLVSNGIPFPKGALKTVDLIRIFDAKQELSIYTEALAYWPDGSIRSALIQLRSSATALASSLILRTGERRQTSDLKRSDIPRIPEAVAFPDPSYLTATAAFGPLTPAGMSSQHEDPSHREIVEAYDRRQKEGFERLRGSELWGNDVRYDGYYSTSLNWYLHFIRSGDLNAFQWARRELLHYRDDQIVKTGPKAGTMNGRSEPRYLYLRAMEADYLLTGDPETLRIAGIMANYLLNSIPESFFFFPRDSKKFWTERRVAFPLLGIMVYGRMSGDKKFLDATHSRVDMLLKTQDQYPDGGWIHNLYYHDPEECFDINAYGGSPFMTGLLFEALIAYYEWFEDPRIVSSIKKATDWLFQTAWRGRGFAYMAGCGYESGGGKLASLRGAHPDLNLLIIQGYGFAYWAGGKEQRYLDMGWDILYKAVTYGSLGVGFR